MLGDITAAKKIYLACGYTDMRKFIDGLAAVIQQQFKLEPFQPALFLLCDLFVCHKIRKICKSGRQIHFFEPRAIIEHC